MTEYTSIRVSEDLADRLYELKRRGESYEDVIRMLLREAGYEDTEE